MNTIKYIRLLDALSDALGDSEDQTPDEIRVELRKDGVNIDAIEKQLSAFQRKLSGRLVSQQNVQDGCGKAEGRI